jgi:catechol 2,3-dioxygenase
MAIPSRPGYVSMMADSPDRLPDDIHLGAVHLQVSDLARSLAYYEEVLGLRRMRRDGGPAVLGPHGDETPLVVLHERPGAAPVARRARLGLYHFAILLPDRPSLGRFVTHLARIGARAGASDHLVSEALYLTDPDGLGIEVYADRPRSDWTWRDGELVMSTEPLDLARVTAAAGGEEWTGMPAGTRMGHLHLHVGALPEAAAFYQETLGLAPTVRSYPGALFLSAGGYHHHLGLNTWAGPTAAVPTDTDARLLEWTVVVPTPADAEAAATRMTSAGREVSAEADGWLLTDPWGTRLRLRAAPA